MIATKLQSVGISRSVAVAHRCARDSDFDRLASSARSPLFADSLPHRSSPYRCRRVRGNAISQDPVHQKTMLSSVSLPMVTMLLASAPALAEEAATGEAGADAVDMMGQNSGILGYTNGGLVIAFSPLVIYGVFYLYRATVCRLELVTSFWHSRVPMACLLSISPMVYATLLPQINPKAKLADLLFVTAACVVLGNILSILVFHVRLY
jgi:hypothetical protein